MSSINYTLLPATPSDAPSVLTLVWRAYATNLVDRVTYPKELAHLTPPSELHAWRLKRIETALSAPDAIWCKVVPASSPDKLIGMAGWYKPGHFTNGKGAASIVPSAADFDEEAARPDPPPACRNDTVNRELLAHFDSWRAKIWGDNAQFWYLGMLTVDPDYQRQGIGGMLMREGLRRADADGSPSYIEATPDGTPMYPKFGYEKVGEFAMLEGGACCYFVCATAGDVK